MRSIIVVVLAVVFSLAVVSLGYGKNIVATPTKAKGQVIAPLTAVADTVPRKWCRTDTNDCDPFALQLEVKGDPGVVIYLIAIFTGKDPIVKIPDWVFHCTKGKKCR